MGDDEGGRVVIAITAILCGTLGWSLGYSMGVSSEKAAAVRAGAAHWAIDAATGEKRFVYDGTRSKP